MKAAEGRIGRVFIIRLDDGDRVLECIEAFAEENNIAVGLVTLIGGIGDGEIVSGPRRSEEMPPDPICLPVDGAHEVLGMGVLAPGPDGRAALHMHGALGRAGKTAVGCLRFGVDCWLVGEVIIYEILDTSVQRKLDPRSGFFLLEP
ncbi:MAG: DNA-binding protein [Dethiobacter sp.]|jgi:predicted DNA-binding protein with PD1-like motif|nr:DNA-binding protein [Dethiobacter sp.]